MVTARRRDRQRSGERDNPSPRPCHRAPAADYRSRARRLRARFQGQPALLQQSLRALSRDCDAARGVGRRTGVVTPALTAVFEVSEETTRRFSRMVGEHLEGQILRFERRQLLIRAASRMGIDRFQANLIIAAVQHAQMPGGRAPEDGRDSVGGRMMGVALFLLVQGAMALALWRILGL